MTAAHTQTKHNINVTAVCHACIGSSSKSFTYSAECIGIADLFRQEQTF